MALEVFGKLVLFPFCEICPDYQFEIQSMCCFICLNKHVIGFSPNDSINRVHAYTSWDKVFLLERLNPSWVFCMN